MREKAMLPAGCVAVGTSLMALAWISGLALNGAGIGCVVTGLLILAWRTGRHFECGAS